MKFFDKLFKKNEPVEEPQLEEVKLSEVKEWLNTKFGEIYTKKEVYVAEIKEKIDNVRNDLSYLKELEFPADTDNRVKSRVLDNVNAYTNQTTLFLDKIEPKDLSLDKLKEYIKIFYFELDKVNKSTIKNYYIIQAMFRNSAAKVAADVKSLQQSFDSLNNIVSSNKFVGFFDISAKLDKLLEKNDVVIDLNDKLDSLKKDHESLLNEITDIKEAIQKFNDSNDYKDYSKMEAEKEEAEKELSKIKEDIVNVFSKFDRLLRKYYRVYESKVLDSYVQSPLALLDDKELEILKIMNELKIDIETKKFIVDDKEKKLIENIDQINKGMLSNLVFGYNQKLVKIKEIEHLITKSNILKTLIDYNYKISSNKYKVDNIDKDVMKIESKLSEINFDGLLTEFEENILGVLGIEVKIIR